MTAPASLGWPLRMANQAPMIAIVMNVLTLPDQAVSTRGTSRMRTPTAIAVPPRARSQREEREERDHPAQPERDDDRRVRQEGSNRPEQDADERRVEVRRRQPEQQLERLAVARPVRVERMPHVEPLACRVVVRRVVDPGRDVARERHRVAHDPDHPGDERDGRRHPQDALTPERAEHAQDRQVPPAGANGERGRLGRQHRAQSRGAPTHRSLPREYRSEDSRRRAGRAPTLRIRPGRRSSSARRMCRAGRRARPSGGRGGGPCRPSPWRRRRAGRSGSRRG